MTKRIAKKIQRRYRQPDSRARYSDAQKREARRRYKPPFPGFGAVA